MKKDYDKLFDEKTKIQVFDKIAENYFDKNFGSMTKVNFETLLFSEYIEATIKKGENFDDYTLSKQLGITQNSVRTLKERKELKYPHIGFKWKESFAECVKNAKYDKDDKFVKMIIEDINVMNEVRHYIENKGWFDEVTLNKKMLKIKLDCFVFLCINNVDFNGKFKKEALENINKLKYKEEPFVELLKDFSQDSFKKFLKYGSKVAIAQVLKIIPINGLPKTIINNLASVIEET